MTNDYPSRPWQRLHLFTWCWLATIVIASLAANLATRETGPGDSQFGWPNRFANVSVAQSIEFGILPVNRLFPGHPGHDWTSFSGEKQMWNVAVCVAIVSLSTAAVELWTRQLRIPRSRVTLLALLAIVAWAALGYLFIGDEVNWARPVVANVQLAHRACEWSLFVLYLGSGLAVYEVLDLIARTIEHIRLVESREF